MLFEASPQRTRTSGSGADSVTCASSNTNHETEFSIRAFCSWHVYFLYFTRVLTEDRPGICTWMGRLSVNSELEFVVYPSGGMEGSNGGGI